MRFIDKWFSPQSAERSFAARRTFADEHIERWAPAYLANPYIARRGVLFETFLFAPAEILAACAPPAMTVSRRGLLQPQLDVRRRIELEAALQELGERAIAALAAESHCANGVWTEKLKHHTWPPRRWAKRKLMEVSDGN
jgi:hypothetical protein